MTSTYDESVMNFDLGFLQQTTKSTAISKIEKQRKAILLAKQKTITTDGLIRKYYNKKELLEQTERTLFASKEECKQVCIDYKNVLEKCEKLENELQVVQKFNQQLQQKLSDAENQCCGIQSHARQLEVLVKEQETTIESLKIENHLEKSNSKNFATSTSSLQSKNESLLQDLGILVKLLIGKKKCKPEHEAVLQKYKKHIKLDEDSCIDSEDSNSDHETDLDNLMSPQSELGLGKDEPEVQSNVEVQEVIVVNLDGTGKDETSKPSEIDGCSVCSNDIASADTGRGSSLTFSDSEKCFRSPDYSPNDNHRSPEFNIKPMTSIGVCTSPIRDTIDIATSPIHFETQKVPTITFDKAVSPLKSINVSDFGEIKSSQIIMDNSVESHRNNECRQEETVQADISNIYDDESRDCEIEMILSTMQFNRDLITPMPSSPCSVSSRSRTSSRVYGSQTNHNEFVVCHDAAKLKEENKILHANIADLAKEIMNIKSILKINPLDLPGENVYQKEVTNAAKSYKSNTSHERKNIEGKKLKHNTGYDNAEERHVVEKNVQNHNENDNTNERRNNEGKKLNNHNENNITEERHYAEAKNLKNLVEKDDANERHNVVGKKLKNHNENGIVEVRHNAEGKNLKNHIENDNADERQNVERNRLINPKEYDKADESHNLEGNLKNIHENDNADRNNIKGQNLKNHTDNDDAEDDLIDMVDLIQICSEDMDCSHFDDFCEARELEEIDENTINSFEQSSITEIPIVIIEEQENNNNEGDGYNTNEGIMSRLEFEEDAVPPPIQNSPENIYGKNAEMFEASAKQDNIENSCNEKLRRKLRKANKLDKLRREMVPKCKIRREKEQTKRKNVIKKQIGKPVRQIRLNPTPKKKITSADTAASLNDKSVYNKAVQIMSELKGKQSDKSPKKSLSAKQNKKSVNGSRTNEESPNSVKRRLFEVSKLPSEISEKPFDISDLISNQIPRPVIKSILASPEISKFNCMDKELKNKFCLKNLQPIVCIDKITGRPGEENQCIDKDHNIAQSFSPSVTTRSRSRFTNQSKSLDHEPTVSVCDNHGTPEIYSKDGRKQLKRVASDEKREIKHKRILRSSSRLSNSENINTKVNNNKNNLSDNDYENPNLTSPRINKSKNEKNSPVQNSKPAIKTSEFNSAVSYDDLNMFDEDDSGEEQAPANAADFSDLKESILCIMLEKYSLHKTRFQPKKIPDGITNSIRDLLEESIKEISELQPKEAKPAMDTLVEKLQYWNIKQFLAGFMNYLQDPQRKVELYNKVNSPPAPPMTKPEQIFIYVIIQLRYCWTQVDILTQVLNSIEYVMFKLNRSPEFDVVESMSHFYAVLCRYFKLKTRLRLFMLDAMYCMQYKAIALIRQCMDVWMHVLPLAHMGIAKNPLVTCVVYLLHFYKCEDHFHRVQDVRNILHRKYSYQMSDWNETKVLEMFRNAIYELRDIPIEKKILRLSLIILAKRQGARWCQRNILSNILQPIIENKDSSSLLKQFCVSVIGPLLKPFPVDMKVHCEIYINLLLDMKMQNPPQPMEEAIITSLLYMSKHNQDRVVSTLLTWRPKRLSRECEASLRDYIREKPANAWKSILSRLDMSYLTQDSIEYE